MTELTVTLSNFFRVFRDNDLYIVNVDNSEELLKICPICYTQRPNNFMMTLNPTLVPKDGKYVVYASKESIIIDYFLDTPYTKVLDATNLTSKANVEFSVKDNGLRESQLIKMNLNMFRRPDFMKAGSQSSKCMQYIASTDRCTIEHLFNNLPMNKFEKAFNSYFVNYNSMEPRDGCFHVTLYEFKNKGGLNKFGICIVNEL